MDASAVPVSPLASRMISRFDPTSDDVSPGRRLRVFAALVQPSRVGFPQDAAGAWWSPGQLADGATYGELLRLTESDGPYAGAREALSHLPLRVGLGPLIRELPAAVERSRDPELHLALQDLANEINEDIREALEVLDDPRAYYPGVDIGIEPVTEEHVRLTVWALQRELDRELRSSSGYNGPGSLPAAPLAELPGHVQRALVERRRLRFMQWGIGRAQWEANDWSLWDVPEDVSYLPRRAERLAGLQMAA